MTKKKEAIENKGHYVLPPSESPSFAGAYERALELVRSNIPIVLFGPPGTGKTKIASDISEALKSNGELGNFELIQFHRKYTYEDFIEGYAPSADGGFVPKQGSFKKFCSSPSSSQVDLFVIDEMNRAELSSTFGEVLYALEDRGERTATTAHFKDEFKIPMNLSMVGTMNTADRNISIVDYALRRRFRFIPVYPDSTELQKWLNTKGFSFNEFEVADYVGFFATINKRIISNALLGSHMQLGQSMFVPPIKDRPLALGDLVANFVEVLIPQIEAYFGFGSQTEMVSIFNPSIVSKYLKQETISGEDFTAMVMECVGEN